MVKIDVEGLKTLIKLQALITERDAMNAENTMRQESGLPISYGEDAFFELSEKMTSLLEDL